MTPGSRIALSARMLVGVPFRPHGRSAERGVDCVGVVLIALRGAGWAGQDEEGYSLRCGSIDHVAQRLAEAGLCRAGGQLAAGDVLIFRSAPGQLHFAIATESGLIHADAGARRVVERPGLPDWPVLGRWRLSKGE